MKEKIAFARSLILSFFLSFFLSSSSSSFSSFRLRHHAPGGLPRAPPRLYPPRQKEEGRR
jgi:hypothetical protein